jgi:hypothetical protein
MALRRLVQVRRRQEIFGLMPFLPLNQNNEALAGCNDVVVLKAWVVHRALAGCFRFLLFGPGMNGRLHARLRDKLIGLAARVLHPLLPLFERER